MQQLSLFGSKARPNSRRRFVQHNIVDPFQSFMATESAGGLVIVIAAVVALVWANSPWDQSYQDLWHSALVFDVGVLSVEESLGHFVNDGLMVIFFFVVGLEIKRELVHGELATPRRAVLPVAAAAGGMIAPALLYVALNGTAGDAAKGWGVPVATDIAFAIGILALVGSRVPFGIKIFLLALAIVDDLGGILVIAVFYTSSISYEALGWAALVVIAILALRSYDVRSYNIYIVLGVLLWLAVLESGIHATLAGVVLAMLTPSRPLYSPEEWAGQAQPLIQDYRTARSRGDLDQAETVLRDMEGLSRETESPLDRLTHMLHPWVSYVIVPVFALANAGVAISGQAIGDAVVSEVTLGIILGLVVGKPVGIVVLTYLAVRLGFASLPAGVNWRHITGAGFLGGVGFTVALFITDLAFVNEALITDAKMGILAASAIAGTLGFLYLYLGGKPAPASEAEGGP